MPRRTGARDLSSAAGKRPTTWCIESAGALSGGRIGCLLGLQRLVEVGGEGRGVLQPDGQSDEALGCMGIRHEPVLGERLDAA